MIVVAKAVMEEELVKQAAVEELVAVEVKEEGWLVAVEEVKAVVEMMATIVGGVGSGGGHVDEGRDGAGRHGGRCGAGRRADGQNQTGVTGDRRRGGGSGGDRRDKRDRRGERGGQARGDYYCEIRNVDNYF